MRILLVYITVLLSGCAFISPRSHDPVMFDHLISIKLEFNKTSCSNKDWGTLLDKVHHLTVYSDSRGDPQAKNIAQLKESLLVAHNSKNDAFCNSILTINKTRIEVIEDAWKGRR